MTTVEWLKEFKMRIFLKTDKKTSWGRVELMTEIERAYQETLEKMVVNQND